MDKIESIVNYFTGVYERFNIVRINELNNYFFGIYFWIVVYIFYGYNCSPNIFNTAKFEVDISIDEDEDFLKNKTPYLCTYKKNSFNTTIK